ncbi:UNVERIFIED_CONTAM: hypothetical protein PYX00_011513 [Menopon gallinae]|uniref:Uncharacterized protein n=1 Tax=Menopon gallinae TaxID=328185 RepID=A0AAW2H7U2_9NEOP
MIGAMRGLTVLDARRCGILPGHLAHLLGLRKLKVSGNRHMGEGGLATIECMESLMVVDISRCGLQESAHRHIGALRDLRELYVPHNRLGRDDLSVVGAMESHEVLAMDSCGIKGEVESIRGLAGLRELYVSHNVLDGDDIAMIGGFEGLEVVYTNECKIYGSPAAHRVHCALCKHGTCRDCGDICFRKCSTCGCAKCFFRCRQQSCKRCHRCTPSSRESFHTPEGDYYVTVARCACGEKMEEIRTRIKQWALGPRRAGCGGSE